MAHDQQFLLETLSGLIQVDDFTARLFEVWQHVLKEGITQVQFYYSGLNLATPGFYSL